MIDLNGAMGLNALAGLFWIFLVVAILLFFGLAGILTYVATFTEKYKNSSQKYKKIIAFLLSCGVLILIILGFSMIAFI